MVQLKMRVSVASQFDVSDAPSDNACGRACWICWTDGSGTARGACLHGELFKNN